MVKIKTVVSFLLDETGSMFGVKEKTINSFNEYVQALKGEKNKISMTLTRFNSDAVKIDYVDKAIKDVPELTDKIYQPNAMTPLFDAIGKTAKELKEKLKGQKDIKVLMVILSDGQENYSKEYKLDDIKALIKENEKDSWTFIYLGADQNAWDEASKFGIARGNTLSIKKAAMGSSMAGLARSTVMYAQSSTRQTKNFFNEDK